MTMDAFPHDEIPDTRHDIPAKNGLRGFWEGDCSDPGEVSREERDESSVSFPATRLMTADERAAVLAPGAVGDQDDEEDVSPAEPILPPPPVYSVDGGGGSRLATSAEVMVAARRVEKQVEDDREGMDVTRRFERKTLPSARLTPAPLVNPSLVEEGVDGLSWDGSADVEEPTLLSDVADAFERERLGQTVFEEGAGPEPDSDGLDSSPGLWGRVTRFVAGFGKRMTSAPPPCSSRQSRQRPAIGVLLDLVWMLDEGERDALAAHLERVSALRRLGSDAYADARILEALATLEGAGLSRAGVSMAVLRARLPEMTRESVDAALLRLETRGCVSLMGRGGGFEVMGDPDALRDPVRGTFSRCALKVVVR